MLEALKLITNCNVPIRERVSRGCKQMRVCTGAALKSHEATSVRLYGTSKASRVEVGVFRG